MIHSGDVHQSRLQSATASLASLGVVTAAGVEAGQGPREAERTEHKRRGDGLTQPAISSI